MNENYQAMTEGVLNFLSNLGLMQYYDIFVTKGYDMESDILQLEDSDLDEMKITHKDHRETLKYHGSRHLLTPEYKLFTWLKQYGLDYYFINFVNGDLTKFEDIARLQLTDEKMFEELEILLPGHRKRLIKAVTKLRQELFSPILRHETPVTEGYWGKPDVLTEAKYDFLCVDAIVSSTKSHRSHNSQRLQFMVDSGSDVVTIREEILKTLDLELIGPIQSKGVHASKTKNLFKAHLSLGDEKLVIEVMGESYDSIGSRVIRHFRHYISGGRHIWLKGDYYDPSMIPQNTMLSCQEISASASKTVTPIETSLKKDKDYHVGEQCLNSIKRSNNEISECQEHSLTKKIKLEKEVNL